jgi:hypothetical protein
MDRVTVAEAADRLGVTRDAIRKRIKRGSIEWETGLGDEVFVYVDASATAEDTSATDGDMSEDASRHDAHDALVESLREQVEYLRGEVVVWQDEARRKDHLLAAALERIPALEPPPDTPNPNTPPEATGESLSHSEGNGGSSTAAGDPEQQKPSWWRRFLGVE